MIKGELDRIMARTGLLESPFDYYKTKGQLGQAPHNTTAKRCSFLVLSTNLIGLVLHLTSFFEQLSDWFPLKGLVTWLCSF